MLKLMRVGCVALVCGVIFLLGCSEGPAEKRGKKIDNAVERVSDAVQDKGPAQKVGEKLDEMTE